MMDEDSHSYCRRGRRGRNGEDPTKCLDWPKSNPHTPKSTSDDEVLTLQSLVPKVHFHWAWPVGFAILGYPTPDFPGIP